MTALLRAARQASPSAASASCTAFSCPQPARGNKLGARGAHRGHRAHPCPLVAASWAYSRKGGTLITGGSCAYHRWGRKTREARRSWGVGWPSSGDAPGCTQAPRCAPRAPYFFPARTPLPSISLTTKPRTILFQVPTTTSLWAMIIHFMLGFVSAPKYSIRIEILVAIDFFTTLTICLIQKVCMFHVFSLLYALLL
jgi:hypothetical protein